MQQCVYETKILDIGDMRKCLMQTWFDFEQDIINIASDHWPVEWPSEIMRACYAGGGHL